jgi:hypothetical protein
MFNKDIVYNKADMTLCLWYFAKIPLNGGTLDRSVTLGKMAFGSFEYA